MSDDTKPKEEPERDTINMPCRKGSPDGSDSGCGSTSSYKEVVPNGPTFYVCVDCGNRVIAPYVGGTFKA
jgi:hypothetical protein